MSTSQCGCEVICGVFALRNLSRESSNNFTPLQRVPGSALDVDHNMATSGSRIRCWLVMRLVDLSA